MDGIKVVNQLTSNRDIILDYVCGPNGIIRVFKNGSRRLKRGTEKVVTMEEGQSDVRGGLSQFLLVLKMEDGRP